MLAYGVCNLLSAMVALLSSCCVCVCDCTNRPVFRVPCQPYGTLTLLPLLSRLCLKLTQLIKIFMQPDQFKFVSSARHLRLLRFVRYLAYYACPVASQLLGFPNMLPISGTFILLFVH